MSKTDETNPTQQNLPDEDVQDVYMTAEEDIFEDVDLDDSGDKRERINPLKELGNLFCYVLVILAISYLMVTYVVQRTEVEGSSMQTTLEDGDSVFLDKISYRFSDPQRYDIVVFNYMYQVDTHYIKRVIALPGETVQIIDGYVYVDQNDGKGLTILADDVYGSDVIAPENFGLVSEPITLGEDEYFVLGDNRNNSHDSRKRDVGLVSSEQIIGKAFVRIWPLSSLDWIDP